MQPENSQTTQQMEPNNLARQQQSTIRELGALIGRMLATIGVGVAVRQYRRSNNPAPEQPLTGWQWWLNEFKEEGIVTGATMLSWKSGLGGDVGANVSEHLVDRLNKLADQNYAVLPPYAAPRNTVMADRVTDTLLMRFANYAANSFPETSTSNIGTTPSTSVRFEIPRFF